MTAQELEWKTLPNHIFDKGLISRIYKKFWSSVKKKEREKERKKERKEGRKKHNPI